MKYSKRLVYWNFVGNCKWCGKKLQERRTAKFYCDECRPHYYHHIFNVLGGREWVRSKVRKRDNNTCQDCGKKWEDGMRKFDCHHLDFDGKKSRQVDPVSTTKDIITLCHKCHCVRHKKHRNHLDNNLEPSV